MIRSILAILSSIAVMVTAAPLPRPSPDFAIHLTPSGQVSPTQYKGKVVVLAFISTTCPHCQHTTQVLSGLQREFGPRGLQVLAAAFNPMANVAFVFQTLEYGSRCRFLHEVTLCKGNADVFGRQGAAFPEDAHDELFEIAEWFSSAKHCSATNCSECETVCQTELQTGGYRLN